MKVKGPRYPMWLGQHCGDTQLNGIQVTVHENQAIKMLSDIADDI